MHGQHDQAAFGTFLAVCREGSFYHGTHASSVPAISLVVSVALYLAKPVDLRHQEG